jgi:hypothetical protein
MKKSILFLAALALTMVTPGCYETQDGRYKAGVPMSTDTIVSKYERPLDEVYEATKKVLTFNGQITAENFVTHTFTAKVDNRTVWVRIDQNEPMITRVTTQARDGGRGDIQLAAEIDKQIALNLRVMPAK